MKVNQEKLCYTAPKMGTLYFRTERGYAISGGTEEFNNMDLPIWK